MDFILHPSTLTIALQALIVIAVAVRVIMKRAPSGTALAWIALVAILPFAGALIYLLMGERRIAQRRVRRIEALRTDYGRLADIIIREGITEVDWSRHPVAARSMDRLGHKTVGSPTVRGSSFELFSDTLEMLQTIARDVDAAKTSVLMEFYIWNEGGAADEVLQALIRAAQRGVSCRLLVDAYGAKPWWKSAQPQQLRDAGVAVTPALPTGLWRSFVDRTDLRLHRKIVIIDSEVAWTGSMNLVDPRLFKQEAGVGEWVDSLVRLQGSVVAPLAATMIGDWTLETGEAIDEVINSAGLRLVAPNGSADIQVIPSGPGATGDALLQMLLALINSAQEELVITTPYLVPDASLMLALRGAAGRGVKVSIILPEKVDSLLTRHASRSYYDDLLHMGVQIQLYKGGLLHTKSVMVDGTMSMFGSVNIDLRSLWLDYEVALFVYDPEFAKQLSALQKSYADDAELLDPAAWAARSFGKRLLENTLRLASPLL